MDKSIHIVITESKLWVFVFICRNIKHLIIEVRYNITNCNEEIFSLCNDTNFLPLKVFDDVEKPICYRSIR